MTTIKEDYVSFETAKLLKEKGFDIPCMGRYSVRSKEFHFDCTRLCNNGGLFECSAPTLQMAMKWLRKVYQIAIATNCWFGGERYISWHCTIMCYGENLKTQQDVELPYVATYEEACEAAIKYCLENLI